MWRLKLYRGIWHAVAREGGKTKRQSLSTKDRDKAERVLRDWASKPTGDLIESVMEAYLTDKRTQGAASIKAMEYAWQSLRPTFAHLRPDQVDKTLCRSYRAMRKKVVSDGTVIKELGVLKAALGAAKVADKATFEMPSAPPPRDRYITRQEVDKLASASESAHIELFIRLGWATAGRASAILELTWDRVDFQRGQIRLSRGEGGRKGRATVPMTDSLRKALEGAYRVRTSDHVIEWGGKPVRSISKAFARAAVRAKLAKVSPHILRHSAAVQMAVSGVDIRKIAEYLGHTDIGVTARVYARYRPEHLADAKAALE